MARTPSRHFANFLRLEGQPSRFLLAVPLVLAAWAYARVLGGGFVFDDDITALSPAAKDHGLEAYALLSEFLRGKRPFVDLTFALNYAAGGADAWNYHLVNIAVHFVTVLLLFAFTVRVIERAGVLRARGPALVVAGVFALHPMQSQAVSYVSQVAESLASALYLSTLLLLLAAEHVASIPRRALYVSGAFATFLLGLGTKQIIVTVPLAYLLLSVVGPRQGPTSARLSGLRRLWVLVPFVVAAVWYVRLLFESIQGLRHVGAAIPGMTAGTYFITQWKVILIYLRLIVWPVGQCLDWRYPLVKHLDASTILAGVALAAMAGGAGVVLLRFRRRVGEDAAAARISGLGVLWFFLVLAPTSSFIPIADVLVEHRVYLASWGIYVAAVMLLTRVLARLGEEKRKIVAVSMIGVLWCTLAVCLHARNRVWENALALWSDVVEKAPRNVRARVQLAGAHQMRGDLQRAVAAYGDALSMMAPDDTHYQVQARLGLATSLVDLGRIDDGIAVMESARERDPASPEILASLSEAWWHRGDQARAELFAERALATKPDLGNALLVLGAAKTAKGDLEGAAEVLGRAVKGNPDGAIPRINLASVYARLGRIDRACAVWREVLRLPSAFPDERERARHEASAAGCAGM